MSPKLRTLLKAILLCTLASSGLLAQTLVGHWTFEPGVELKDLTGNFNDLVLGDGAFVAGGALHINAGGWAQAIGYTGPTIREKTLISWVRLDNLDVTAGSILTIDKTDVDEFDGIVYAERQARRWMAGSNGYARTQDPVPGFEETTTGELVQMAITYQDAGSGAAHIKIYRNGFLIGDYIKGSLASWSGANTEIVFGRRHTLVNAAPGQIDGQIEEARIYDGVLTQAEIQAIYAGGLVPVELTSFAASTTTDGVLLTWSTGSETENLGFHIYRSNEAEGDYTRINNTLIPGAGNSAKAHTYQFLDTSVQTGNTYFYKLADVDFNGTLTFHGSISVTVETLPTQYALEQNFPNPFNPATTIRFQLPEAGNVHLAIYNTTGQQVRTLVDGEMAAGSHSVLWDGTDDLGARVASGVYLAVLRAGSFTDQKKLVLAK